MGDGQAASEERYGKTHSFLTDETESRSPTVLTYPLGSRSFWKQDKREFLLLQTHLHFCLSHQQCESHITSEEMFVFSKGKLLVLSQISGVQGHSQQVTEHALLTRQTQMSEGAGYGGKHPTLGRGELTRPKGVLLHS